MRVRYAAIFGATGPAGRFVGQELSRRGIPFRAVARRADMLARTFSGMEGAEIFPADLADPEQAARAAEGADVIFHTVGVPYPSFHLHPQLARRTVEAAARAGARAVLVSNVYS
ncbi:MAG: NAD(P)H-binding protein, partial [Bacillota bacterium]|nr:NAD(P)H-binding protein [Bacillota bacterium]